MQQVCSRGMLREASRKVTPGAVQTTRGAVDDSLDRTAHERVRRDIGVLLPLALRFATALNSVASLRAAAKLGRGGRS